MSNDLLRIAVLARKVKRTTGHAWSYIYRQVMDLVDGSPLVRFEALGMNKLQALHSVLYGKRSTSKNQKTVAEAVIRRIETRYTALDETLLQMPLERLYTVANRIGSDYEGDRDDRDAMISYIKAEYRRIQSALGYDDLT